MNKIRAFLKDDSGATVIEYGLIVALISIVSVVTFTKIGEQLDLKFKDVNTALGGKN